MYNDLAQFFVLGVGAQSQVEVEGEGERASANRCGFMYARALVCK